MSKKIKVLFIFILVAILAAPGLRSALAQGEDHLHVNIDIKPGSYPNAINLKSNGNVPVALLGSADFDVSSVDLATVKFGKMHEMDSGASALRSALQDINGDGFMDRVFHFTIKETGLEPSDTMACLHGMTLDGMHFCGHDSVKIIG
jgi:uncharacterized protein (DUF2141 family)